MRTARLVLVVLLAVSLWGCAQPASRPTTGATQPAPTTRTEEKATQVPAQPTTALTAVPTAAIHNTPSPGKGNVIGAISRVPRGLPVEPMAGRTLYLAKFLQNAQGQLAGVAGLDEKEAPSAVADDEGRFIFQDVEPGYYALIIKHPLTLILAHDLTTKRDVVTEVKAGATGDLGKVQVEIND